MTICHVAWIFLKKKLFDLIEFLKNQLNVTITIGSLGE